MMPPIQFKVLLNPTTLAAALSLLLTPWSLAHASTQVQERRAANPQGTVEVINVAGSIEIQGWDRPEVEVSGTAGKDVERVEVTGDSNRTSVRVVLPQHSFGVGNDGAANLLVHVPINSSISTTLVSSDLKVAGVRGELTLQTVSGNISGEGGGDLRANSVSGSIRFSAPAAKSVEVKAISGDIDVTAGDADAEVTTVSGNAKIHLGIVPRARIKSVSGDLTASLAMASAAQVEGETVSGDIKIEFPSVPSAEFDVETFSGSIDSCFGPKPTETRHGPGSRLTFKNGDGAAHVRLSTKSGDLRLCAKKNS
jgi:DUF4097 and DUF4098 domain-containing protein YvlB